LGIAFFFGSAFVFVATLFFGAAFFFTTRFSVFFPDAEVGGAG
jgi:hypothetical protein